MARLMFCGITKDTMITFTPRLACEQNASDCPPLCFRLLLGGAVRLFHQVSSQLLLRCANLQNQQS